MPIHAVHSCRCSIARHGVRLLCSAKIRLYELFGFAFVPVSFPFSCLQLGEDRGARIATAVHGTQLMMTRPSCMHSSILIHTTTVMLPGSTRFAVCALGSVSASVPV
jgi:hypothetical protein